MSPEDWWVLLGLTTRHDNDEIMHVGVVDPQLEVMERTGYLWIRRQGNGYDLITTREGRVAAHRWAAKQAKEAARVIGSARAPGA